MSRERESQIHDPVVELMAGDRWALLLTLFISLCPGLPAAKEATMPFPSLPEGWKYRQLLDAERSLQGLPSEVMGVLENQDSQVGKVEFYIAQTTLGQPKSKGPFDQAAWMVETFTPGGIVQPHVFTMERRTKVGPNLKWSFQELRINRSGIAVNLAWFHRRDRDRDLAIVLRGEGRRYSAHLSVLKSFIKSVP